MEPTCSMVSLYGKSSIVLELLWVDVDRTNFIANDFQPPWPDIVPLRQDSFVLSLI